MRDSGSLDAIAAAEDASAADAIDPPPADAEPAFPDATPDAEATPDADAGADSDSGFVAPDAEPAADASPPSCPTIGPPVAIGHVAIGGLAELSGIVAGRVNPDVYWTHGDNLVDLYAIDRATLALRAVYHLSDANGGVYGDGDVEDIAIRPLPGGGAEIYLGDIGSNHPDLAIHIYRVAEPMLPAMSVDAPLEAEQMDVSGLRIQNAETLLVDPADGSLVIVEKERNATACAVGTFQTTMLAIPSCTVAVTGIENPSGGDVSPDGTYVAIRNEELAYVWIRPQGATLEEAFNGMRCPFATLATPSNSDECNGEALGFAAGGLSLITGSEAAGCPMTNLHTYTFTP